MSKRLIGRNRLCKILINHSDHLLSSKRVTNLYLWPYFMTRNKKYKKYSLNLTLQTIFNEKITGQCYLMKYIVEMSNRLSNTHLASRRLLNLFKTLIWFPFCKELPFPFLIDHFKKLQINKQNIETQVMVQILKFCLKTDKISGFSGALH